MVKAARKNAAKATEAAPQRIVATEEERDEDTARLGAPWTFTYEQKQMFRLVVVMISYGIAGTVIQFFSGGGAVL
ncbi:hypothetical protein M885DRAFT_570429 [Pelagophyceae sp. CCMP2097]|nr:hypothetical protein M885DRAFT_570429 [Pelagophyceae sp. CCMP2097]